MGGGSHNGRGLLNQTWKPWDATALRRGGEGDSKRCAHKTKIAKCWCVSFRIRFGIVYRKGDLRLKGEPAGGIGGSLKSRAPMIVQSLWRRSENAAWDDSKELCNVSCTLAKRTSPILVQLNQRYPEWRSVATRLEANCCSSSWVQSKGNRRLQSRMAYMLEEEGYVGTTERNWQKSWQTEGGLM